MAQRCSLWELKGCSGPVTASTQGLVWVRGLVGEQRRYGDGKGTGCRHFCAEGTERPCHAAGVLQNGVIGQGVESLSLGAELCCFLHSGKFVICLKCTSGLKAQMDSDPAQAFPLTRANIF